jgi:hypothetical protein
VLGVRALLVITSQRPDVRPCSTASSEATCFEKQVDDDASFTDIKAAYRNLAKTCHPDFLGVKGHDVCILLNEVIYCVPTMK